MPGARPMSHTSLCQPVSSSKAGDDPPAEPGCFSPSSQQFTPWVRTPLNTEQRIQLSKREGENNSLKLMAIPLFSIHPFPFLLLQTGVLESYILYKIFIGFNSFQKCLLCGKWMQFKALLNTICASRTEPAISGLSFPARVGY